MISHKVTERYVVKPYRSVPQRTLDTLFWGAPQLRVGSNALVLHAVASAREEERASERWLNAAGGVDQGR